VVVCRHCGVAIGVARKGGFVHLDGLPDGVDEHEAVPVDQQEYTAVMNDSAELRVKIEELIRHHGMFHPLSDCQFADRARAMLRVL